MSCVPQPGREATSGGESCGDTGAAPCCRRRVALFFLDVGAATPTAAQVARLQPEERTRVARFVFDKDRKLAVFGRLLLRSMARAALVPPPCERPGAPPETCGGCSGGDPTAAPGGCFNMRAPAAGPEPVFARTALGRPFLVAAPSPATAAAGEPARITPGGERGTAEPVAARGAAGAGCTTSTALTTRATDTDETAPSGQGTGSRDTGSRDTVSAGASCGASPAAIAGSPAAAAADFNVSHAGTAVLGGCVLGRAARIGVDVMPLVAAEGGRDDDAAFFRSVRDTLTPREVKVRVASGGRAAVAGCCFFFFGFFGFLVFYRAIFGFFFFFFFFFFIFSTVVAYRQHTKKNKTDSNPTPNTIAGDWRIPCPADAFLRAVGRQGGLCQDDGRRDRLWARPDRGRHRSGCGGAAARRSVAPGFLFPRRRKKKKKITTLARYNLNYY
jgi:hypothetical protein